MFDLKICQEYRPIIPIPQLLLLFLKNLLNTVKISVSAKSLTYMPVHTNNVAVRYVQ